MDCLLEHRAEVDQAMLGVIRLCQSRSGKGIIVDQGFFGPGTQFFCAEGSCRRSSGFEVQAYIFGFGIGVIGIGCGLGSFVLLADDQALGSSSTPFSTPCRKRVNQRFIIGNGGGPPCPFWW